jgi:hypothetical protein
LATAYTSSKVTIEASEVDDSGAVTASMTFFASDGSAEPTDPTALVGDVIPFGIKGSGDTTGVTVELVYNSALVTVAGVASGSTITLTTGYTTYDLTAVDPDDPDPFDDCLHVVDVGDESTGETGILCSLADTEGKPEMFMSGDKTSITPNNAPGQTKVGQMVSLQVERVPASGPATVIGSGLSWSLLGGAKDIEPQPGSFQSTSGDYVLDFNGDNDNKQVTGLGAPNDTNNPAYMHYHSAVFAFYWSNSLTGGTRLANAFVADPQAANREGATVQGTFTVGVPCGVTVTAKQYNGGQANMGVNFFNYPLEVVPQTITISGQVTPNPWFGNEQAMQFGNKPLPIRAGVGTPGMQYSGNTPGGWKYAYVQIITYNASSGEYSGGANSGVPQQTGGVPYTASYPEPRTGLDNVFPYQGPFNSPNTAATEDSPFSAIYRGGTATLSYKFTTWYMAQPVNTGAATGIWVPLASLQWSIDVTATWSWNNAAPTVVVAKSKAPWASGNTFVTSTAYYPEWAGTVTPDVVYKKGPQGRH